ncbi:MAG: NADH-quinone oxidoreductase subunit J, partial [Gammaproteobacteria bacterium]
IGGAIGLALAAELALVFVGWHFLPYAGILRHSPAPAGVPNTMAIGDLLYTRYILLFQLAGIILLVAMIGAIVLTLRERGPNRRQQSIAVQNAREAADTLVMVKAAIGAGIDEIGVFRPLPEQPAAPAQVGEDASGHAAHLAEGK